MRLSLRALSGVTARTAPTSFRVLFMGTDLVSRPTLERLVESQCVESCTMESAESGHKEVAEESSALASSTELFARGVLHREGRGRFPRLVESIEVVCPGPRRRHGGVMETTPVAEFAETRALPRHEVPFGLCVLRERG